MTYDDSNFILLYGKPPGMMYGSSSKKCVFDSLFTILALPAYHIANPYSSNGLCNNLLQAATTVHNGKLVLTGCTGVMLFD